jgi:hypothetical protein
MASLDPVAVAGTDICQQKWRPEEDEKLALEGKLCLGAGFDVLNIRINIPDYISKSLETIFWVKNT